MTLQNISNDTENVTQTASPELVRQPWLRLLDAVSMAYVMLPTLLFLVGYLKPWLGWPAAAALIIGGGTAWFKSSRDAVHPLDAEFRWDSVRFLTIAVLVFGVVACTGMGAFTFQFFDYKGYDGILLDYMQQSWPVAYAEAGPDRQPLALVLYSAYWLVPATVGRFIGWVGAYYFTYLWSVIGVLLATIWFMRIVGRFRVSLALLFLFFGGLDILGRLFTEGPPWATGTTLYDFFTGAFWWSESRGWLDHWASGFMLTDPELSSVAGGVFFRFYSPFSFLVDGPYHVIPSALTFLMIVHDLWRRRAVERLGLLWANFPLGSLFFSVGSLPFIAVGIWEHRGRGIVTLANLCSVPAAIAVLLYFSSVTSVGRVSGWIWEFQDLSTTWWILAVHYLTEFVLLFIFIPLPCKKNLLPHPLWILGCVCFFVLAPWYRIGEYNDFASKIIIAAQIVFMLWLAIGIFHAETVSQRWRAKATIVLLLFGSLASLGAIARALDFGLAGAPPPVQRVRHFNEMEPRTLVLQGKADLESPFWKYLAKEPQFRNTPPIFSTLRWDFVNLQEPIDYWIFFVERQDFEQSESGLTIRTQGNRPILRRDGMELDSEKVGMIRLDVDITVDGKPAKDAAIVAQWATVEQAEAAGEDWPFERWHANQAYPVLNIVSSNSYWRGTIGEMAFYLRVPKDDERVYEVTIREIAFLER